MICTTLDVVMIKPNFVIYISGIAIFTFHPLYVEERVPILALSLLKVFIVVCIAQIIMVDDSQFVFNIDVVCTTPC